MPRRSSLTQAAASSPRRSMCKSTAAGFMTIAIPTRSTGFRLAIFCAMARFERVDLGARGFFATPGVDYNRETGRGNPFFYFTTGAAIAEVTIDRFTGELTFDRGDLLMDIGKMINPGVDRGQVIGGFIQGVGWVTDEELRYDDDGALLSTGPTTYKIPNITDLPRVLNVDFMDNPKHNKNVRLSKAVGEPPLMLGLAVWLAARHALSFVAAGRRVELSIPATSEELLLWLTELERPTAQPTAKPSIETKKRRQERRLDLFARDAVMNAIELLRKQLTLAESATPYVLVTLVRSNRVNAARRRRRDDCACRRPDVWHGGRRAG